MLVVSQYILSIMLDEHALVTIIGGALISGDKLSERLTEGAMIKLGLC
jgi:hypothetical protein